MTTEIAILNKAGIALATDSAVTIGGGGSAEKVYNTANKLFTASKYAPVGIMLYDRADFMGVPWEIIIKMYREHLCKQRFDSLEHYRQNFFAFLADFNFGPSEEKNHVLGAANGIFLDTLELVKEAIQSELKKGEKVDERKATDILRKKIAERAVGFEKQAASSSYTTFSLNEQKAIASKYRKEIIGVAKRVFDNRPLTSTDRSCLVNTIVNAVTFGPDESSGIVISGYGEKNLYPAYYDNEVKSVLGNKVIMKSRGSTDPLPENSTSEYERI